MATVWIPSLMRDLTDGKQVIHVSGGTVGQIVEALDRAHPGIRERLCDGDQTDPAIAVRIDGRLALLGLLEPVGEQSDVLFLPTMGGG